jgi:hypothetical protein
VNTCRGRSGGREYRLRGYEPGGASRHRSAGCPDRSEKKENLEIVECKDIVSPYDAVSIACKADPGAFFIK